MTDKKKKPRSFVNERKPIERMSAAKQKLVEKPKTVRERIIEEHKKGMASPLIARLLNVSNNFVAKVLYLHKKAEASIVKPVISEPKPKEKPKGVNKVERLPYPCEVPPPVVVDTILPCIYGGVGIDPRSSGIVETRKAEEKEEKDKKQTKHNNCDICRYKYGDAECLYCALWNDDRDREMDEEETKKKKMKEERKPPLPFNKTVGEVLGKSIVGDPMDNMCKCDDPTKSVQPGPEDDDDVDIVVG